MKTNIQIKKHSGIYTMWCSQTVEADIDSVWEFFATPLNLAKITPPHMQFNITSPIKVDKMHAGQLITYVLKPFPFYSTNWVTEITHVEHKKMFIDEQRFGPYAMWHHIHTFEETQEGKVIMKDFVSFKMPFGFLGNLGASFVKNQVRKIFEHRFKVVDETFVNNKHFMQNRAQFTK